MRFMKRVFFGLTCTSILLTGCSTLSQQECETGDWHGIGYFDGRNGHPVTRLNDHQKACAEYSIPINTQIYMQARADGLLQYCQPESGYQEGRNGREYKNVCPFELESAFLMEYRLGEKIYLQEQKVKEKEQLIGDTKRELNQIKDRIRSINNKLKQGGPSSQKRTALLQELHEAEHQVIEKRIQLNGYETQLVLERTILNTLLP